MLEYGFYNMDCMDGMKEFPDKYFDLAIVDPIYGDVRTGGYLTGKSCGGVGPHPKYDYSIWKQKKTDRLYFQELFRVSKNQIIFGGNYFIEEIAKNSSCRIVWDKCNGNSITQGNIAQGNKLLNEKRIHPTQKPVALYTWILQNIANEG